MAVSPDNLLDLIEKNKSKRGIATKIIENNPRNIAVLPKLVGDPNLGSVVEDNKKNNFQINRNILENIYNRIRSVKQNNKNIIKLFPDIELAIQILVSSILSPKKMTDIQLNYKFNKTFTLNPTISGDILETVKTYINDTYELEDKLSEIIRDAMFGSGAWVLAVIPESSVDDIINSDILPSYSNEEFKLRADIVMDKLVKPKNFLNIDPNTTLLSDKNSEISKESFVKHLASETFVKITDNANILKFAEIKEKINKSIIRGSLRNNEAISTESLNKLNYIDIFRAKNTSVSSKNVEFIKQKSETNRKNIGRPMTTRIPTESIIPVFIPGNETEHIGYFILLDETGKPLNSEIKDNNISQVNNLLQDNNQAQLSPVQKAYNNLVTDTAKGVNVNELFEMYKGVFERQLYTSIRSSLYGNNVEIANKNDIYFLMFTRALADQKTNVLFIPKDLVVYFAFQYNDIGIGKTLLENLSVLTSLRAILLFSKVMAQAKQSIDVTKVNISLDPSDPDPEKTIEQIQDSVLKLRQNYFPLGISNPVDLLNWIQRAGLQFSYENNPLIPNVKIDFENANMTHTMPNSELEEDLRKQTIIALGLSPETVDNGFNPEFATSVVNNNILLSKRISIYQKTLTKHLSKYHSVIISNDEDLRNTLKEKISKSYDSLIETATEEEKQFANKDKEAFINSYIDKISDNMYVELPKPENTNIANLAVEYGIYKDNLDIVIDSVISAELFSQDVAGKISEHIDTIKNLYKHQLLRNWMTQNNYYPEVLEMFGKNEEETNNMITVISEHLTGAMSTGDKLLRMMVKFKEAVDTDLEKIEGDGATDSTSSSSSSTTDDSSQDDSGNQDDGLGDFDADKDLNLI